MQTNYRSSLPVNYEDIRSIGEIVSNTISARKVPTPEQIAKILGQDAVLPYYFMHALFHNIERGNGRLFLHPIRRDSKALQEHSFSAAFSPYFRYRDQVIPSYFFLTPREVKGNLVHDIPEEFGRTLIGALVDINIIKYVLGRDMGEDANDLTNKNAMLLDPLEARLERINPAVINHGSTYRALNSLWREVKTRSEDIDSQYKRALRALETFRTYVQKEIDYMPGSQKNQLLQIIQTLVTRVEKDVQSKKTLRTGATKPLVKGQYAHVMDVMGNAEKHGAYEGVDGRILLPDDHEFLIVLKNTLYRDSVRGFVQKVMTNARKHASSGDGYLAPAMMKLSDFSHSGKNLDVNIANARSIVLKGSILIDEFAGLVELLRDERYNAERLDRDVRWAYRNLNLGLHDVLNFHEGRSRAETAQESDLAIAKIMKDEIMYNLERRINSMNKPLPETNGNGSSNDTAVHAAL